MSNRAGWYNRDAQEIPGTSAARSLPPDSRLRFVEGLPICRILNGMWQVSGAHGRIDPASAIDAMLAYHDAGFTTWDLADHYGPAEDFIGEFRRRLAAERGEAALTEIQAFTKWVPRPGPMTRQIVENNVDISLRRMGVERLDLLQFHWWEYRDQRYLDALEQLAALRDEGKIHRVALTNFDTERLREIADHGVRVVSNQVQYSLIDRRPEMQMSQVCEEQRVWLLPYGVLCGGLLSDRYLGQPETRPGRAEHRQLAQVQADDRCLGRLAAVPANSWRYCEASRTSMASASLMLLSVYILEKPAVAGVIIGARLGVAEHIAEKCPALRLRPR